MKSLPDQPLPDTLSRGPWEGGVQIFKLSKSAQKFTITVLHGGLRLPPQALAGYRNMWALSYAMDP